MGLSKEGGKVSGGGIVEQATPRDEGLLTVGLTQVKGMIHYPVSIYL